MTTSTNSATSKVDSLYGPGTLLGWYLTLAACLVSWTLHPKKRKRDSIDPDLVVSLTLPIVAVVHLISQVSKLSTLQTNIQRTSRNDASDILQETADAIEAPLVVIEAFMNIAATMFIVACFFSTIRRALLVGTVGIISFATDCFLHLSNVQSKGLSRLFSRSFVADSAIALIMIGVLLAVLVLAAFVITSVFFYNRRGEQNRRIQEAEEETRVLENELDVLAYEDISNHSRLMQLYRMEQLKRRTFKDSRSSKSLTVLTAVFLPLSFVTSLFGMNFEPKRYTASSPSTPLVKVMGNPRAPGLIAFLFPRSNSSLKDLDQRVAVFAGLTALVFSLYSVLSVWYAAWKKNQAQDLQSRRADIMRLRRLVSEGQTGNSA
jgi:hypothetical protein